MSAIIGFLFALLAQLQQLPTAFGLQQKSVEVTRQVTTAQQQQQLTDAATSYIQQNMPSLLTTATATTPAVITVPMLLAANAGVNGLPPGFGTVNPYGQTWQVQVFQPSVGNLRAFVVSAGGNPLTDLQLAGIAAKVGAAGGFVPQNDSGVYPGGAGTAYGNQAGWSAPTTGLAGVTGGHLASIISFNNGSLQNPALYRVKVPGQDQLNVMQTALGMGGNDINNAGIINGTKLYSSGDADIHGNSTVWGTSDNKGEVFSGGWFRTRGNNGWYNEAYNGGWYMQDPTWVRSYADKNVYTGGQMLAGSLRSYGGLTMDGIGYVGGSCTVGTFVRDPSGKMLSCVNGLWSAGGISNVTTILSGWGSNAYAQCPAGTTVTGGSCSNNQGGDGRAVYTRTCAPSGNGWFCADGNGGVCQAAAICAS